MESLKKYNDWQNVLEYAHEEGYQEAVLKYESLLQEAIKQVEEEKKRAKEQKKQAERTKYRRGMPRLYQRIARPEALA